MHSHRERPSHCIAAIGTAEAKRSEEERDLLVLAVAVHVSSASVLRTSLGIRI